MAEKIAIETNISVLGVMMETEATLVMRVWPSIPFRSVVRRVNDVIIGGTRLGRPVGETGSLMTRFMASLLSRGFQ